MLLPCAPFHSLPFLAALRPVIASLLLGVLLPISVVPRPLLGTLLLPVLVLPLLLLGAILLPALIVPLLLLGVLLLPALVLPLLLLGTLRVPLPRGRLPLLLSMLWVGLGLLVPALLLFGMAFLLVLLLLLCVHRSSYSEKQRQSCCAH